MSMADEGDDRLADRAIRFLGLTWALSRKNFQVRYKRASLGVAWAVLQPAIQAAVMSFVFIRVFKVHGIEDYPVYILSGVLPWAFLSQGTGAGSTAVVDNGALVRKVALRIEVFPISAVGGVTMAFASALVVLVAASVITGHLSFSLLLLVPALLLEFAAVCAVALLVSAFHVAYRDVRYVLESLLIVGFYASPVIYDRSRVPPRLVELQKWNPMVGLLSLYRAAVLERAVEWDAVLIATVAITIALVVSLLVFRRRSPEFADLV
jgi:ABC-type polysaccharide/polyol phosphate export permease